jgi:hypothetical protein
VRGIATFTTFAITLGLAVSALTAFPKNTQNPGYENPCEWFVWGNDAFARFYKEAIDGHRYR